MFSGFAVLENNITATAKLLSEISQVVSDIFASEQEKYVGVFSELTFLCIFRILSKIFVKKSPAKPLAITGDNSV